MSTPATASVVAAHGALGHAPAGPSAADPTGRP
ncbi:hypothetical protein ABID81_002733 [Frigoribacterium sp. PvP054]